MPQQKTKTEVFLRTYDLSRGMAKILSKQLIGIQVDAVWHTSIEIFGKEYFFHGGLMILPAGSTPFNPHIERMLMGETLCTEEELETFVNLSRETWTDKNYDIFENNCNHFTNWLANFLVEKDIPREILDLSKKMKENENFKKLFNI